MGRVGSWIGGGGPHLFYFHQQKKDKNKGTQLVPVNVLLVPHAPPSRIIEPMPSPLSKIQDPPLSRIHTPMIDGIPASSRGIPREGRIYTTLPGNPPIYIHIYIHIYIYIRYIYKFEMPRQKLLKKWLFLFIAPFDL